MFRILKPCYSIDTLSAYMKASLSYEWAGKPRRRLYPAADWIPSFPPGIAASYPPVQIEGPIQAALSRADVALGRLDGSVLTLPNPDLFVFMYVRKEAVLSSQIEGTQSSLQDVLAAEAQIFNRDRPSDVREVLNYIEAMRYGLRRLEELPVSVRLIREIHEHLLRGVRGSRLTPGELRTSQNWIGPAGSGLNDATFVPHRRMRFLRACRTLNAFCMRKTIFRYC